MTRSRSRGDKEWRALIAATADDMRRLLDAVDAGEIERGGPEGRATYRRLEGGIAALEALLADRTYTK